MLCSLCCTNSLHTQNTNYSPPPPTPPPIAPTTTKVVLYYYAIFTLLQAIQNQLDTVHTVLERHNHESYETVSQLPPSPLEGGQKELGPRLLLLIEYNLFDLSSHHQCCRHLLSSVLRALTEREKEVKGLHQVMSLLSQCLDEAKNLLARKQGILDVGKFLSDCKV